ncbi:GxxExxY protein [Granulicella sp. dw_53]|uniref:GxxExxY protein n=1 Tax=Granulicella sp. dw_53 TaxID=2719792 RepID=UPI001BD63616|nr:GxxExxY protein [Granulicella sp. dw_53]
MRLIDHREREGSNEVFAGANDLTTEKIIGIFYEVYNELGFGFLESVYREAMRIALQQAGLMVTSEAPIPVSFRGSLVGIFRADLLVEDKVILELKTAELISKGHEAQLLHYLRASEIEVGLVMNFGSTAKFRRLEMKNDRKKRLSSVLLRSEGVRG